jgi:penicillin-binding protein 1A
MDYMGFALNGKPLRDWEQPNGMTMVRIDPLSGLLARAGQEDAIFEIFRTELAPTEYADTGFGGNGGAAGEELLEEDLF